MMQTVQKLPGYRVNEYLLILNPHDELRNRIVQVKKEFHDKYQTGQSPWGKPNLALIRFTQLDMMEERIVQRLGLISMAQHPFKVELKDFGSLPTHTIFINVTTELAVKNLVRQIKSFQRLLKLDNDHKPHFIEDPHFVVARKLLPWQYEKAWREYAGKHFTGRFIADSMLLLKRREGEKAYQIVKRFEFMNLPVETKQGELFA
jgi:hypothetical protein